MAARPELAAFLRAAASEPFRFGEWDCAMTLANWVRAETGIDPGADLRGRYDSPRGWMRLAVADGGLPGLMGRVMLAAGLMAVTDPQDGDVAVLDVPGLGPSGAIRSGSRWVMKDTRGLAAVADLPVLGIWGLR